MSNREHLVSLLTNYKPFNVIERRNTILAAGAIANVPGIFLRENLPVHVCAGYLVTNPSRTKVLLNQHGISGIYMNFGGHADGDENVPHVAKKELEEEAGITKFLSTGAIFDVDCHANGDHMRKGEYVPWHVHYDINFLAVVEEDAPFAISEESHNIQWFSVAEALSWHSKYDDKDEQLHRMYTKLQDDTWLTEAGII